MDFNSYNSDTVEYSILPDVKEMDSDTKCNLVNREYIDLSEFAEHCSLPEKNENRKETLSFVPFSIEQNCSLPRSQSNALGSSNPLIQENFTSSKEPKTGDSNIDWIDNVIFDTSVVPQESDIISLTSFQSQGTTNSVSPNANFIQNHFPDLFDILDESCYPWETSYCESIPAESVQEKEGNLEMSNDFQFCNVVNNSNMGAIETIDTSCERQKRLPPKNTDFPGQVSVFNVMESGDVSKDKDENSLSFLLDTLSHRLDTSEENSLTIEGTSLPDGKYNCSWSESDAVFPAIEMIDKTLGESLDDCNISEFVLLAESDVTKKRSAGISSHVLNEQRSMNSDFLKASVVLNNDGKTKLDSNDQLLVNYSANSDRKKQDLYELLPHNKQINVDGSDRLTVTSESVSSKQVVNEGINTAKEGNSQTSLIFFINNENVQNPQEHVKYQLPYKLQNTVSTKPLLMPKVASAPVLPSSQQLLLLSTGEGQQFLLVCNNSQLQVQKPEMNQTPTIITLKEPNDSNLRKKPTNMLSSMKIASNPQHLQKNKLEHLQIREKNQSSIISTALAMNNCSSKKGIDLTQILSANRSCISFNQPKTPAAVVTCAATSVTNPQKTYSVTERPFTPISVLPISPLVRSNAPTYTPAQSQIVFLSKSDASPSNKNDLVKSKTCNPDVTAVKKCFGKIGQRRKTVRELLEERRKRNILDSVVQSCLIDIDTKSKTNTNLSVTQDAKNLPHLTKVTTPTGNKPSILMLQSDRSKSNESVPVPSSSNVTTLPSSTSCANPTNGKRSFIEDTEEDVDNPEANPEFIPDEATTTQFQRRQVDVKISRPKHFDMNSLEIGDFKVDGEDQKGKAQCKFKILFTKRQFVYEFPLPVDNNFNDEKDMACIIVPFDTVSAISCLDREIRIKVRCQPQAFLGSRKQRVGVICGVNVYNTSMLVDVTSGATAKCPVHKVILRQPHAIRLKLLLWEFDDRFKMLTNISIDDESSEFDLPAFDLICTDSSGCQPVKRSKKDHKLGSRQLPEVDVYGNKCVPKLPQVCSCRISCRSLRCSCAKAAQKCNMGRSLCVCSNCDNPLNVLDTIGIDPELAVLDSCLFQNIYQITHFRRYLRQEMKLPCCSSMATIQECIPGTILCPNTDCMESIQYSWCRAMLCLAERNPRNHCNICGKCNFSMGYHCQNCNACYNKRPRTPSCPKCTTDIIAVQGDQCAMERILSLNELSSDLQTCV